MTDINNPLSNQAGNRNPEDQQYVFVLYIAGKLPNSLAAKNNIQHICKDTLQGACILEIIDIFENAQRAIDNGIIITPTLVIQSPPPIRKIFGNLNDENAILSELGLK